MRNKKSLQELEEAENGRAVELENRVGWIEQDITFS